MHLKRRALKRHLPTVRYTYTLNIKIQLDLARGAYSSMHVIVSACSVPSDKNNWSVQQKSLRKKCLRGSETRVKAIIASEMPMRRAHP